MTQRHTYPPNFGPDTGDPFLAAAWHTLDCYKPGAIPEPIRWHLAGQLAGMMTEMARIMKPQLPRGQWRIVPKSLVDAAQEFVAKVDRGEARSVESYAAFKKALEECGA